MKSIINELWHGNIVPQEDSRNNTKEMKELISYIARHDEVPIKPLIALLYRPSHRATEPLLPSGRCREATEGIKLIECHILHIFHSKKQKSLRLLLSIIFPQILQTQWCPVLQSE